MLRTIFLCILFLFTANEFIYPQLKNDFNLKLKDFTDKVTTVKSRNIESRISLGVGNVIKFVFEDEVYLMLSADFTLEFTKLFYIELGYDYVHKSTGVISVIPGIRFYFPNEESSFNFGFGLALRGRALLFMPSFKYEYQVSKLISMGMEFKSPLGSKNISQLHSNLNFIIHLK